MDEHLLTTMKSLLNNLKFKLIQLPLVKLYYRSRLIVFKRSLKLSSQLFDQIKHRLRLSRAEAKSEGFDTHFDMIVHLAAIRICYPELVDVELSRHLSEISPESFLIPGSRLTSEYAKNQVEVDGLVEKGLHDSQIVSTAERYALVRAFFSAGKKDQAAADYYLSVARGYNPVATALGLEDVNALSSEIRAKNRQLKAAISEREAFKVNLSMINVAPIISGVSSIFLISGYLYNFFLLKHFSVEVSKYFSLGDYLSSSIDAIGYSASGALASLIMYFIGYHSASRESYAKFKIEAKARQTWTVLIVGISWFGTVWTYFQDSELFYHSMYTSILFSVFFIAPRISKHYFKQHIAAFFLIVFVSAFSAHMYESIGVEIYRIDHPKPNDPRRYDFCFKNDVPFDPSDMILIASNSNYLFILDQRKETVILPRDQVKYIKVHKDEGARSTR